LKRFFSIFILTAVGFVYQVNAQQKQEPAITNILFVFDASFSMNSTWENTKKITIARNTLIQMIDSLENLENIRMALRIYGHQSPVPPQDCNDTRLEVRFMPNNAGAIRQKLRFVNPKGTTPLAKSLEASQHDFPKDCDNCRNILILITDGQEECDGDPCEVSQKLQKEGIVLKPFIIGIGIDENFMKTFNCMGRFYNAVNKDQFAELLNVVITEALNSTTAQVNLLDEHGKPTETDVNMTFYDALSGKIKHNYIHTINYKGYPDTIVLDPLITYNMRVNTIPPVTVKNIKVEPGKHTIIGADCPQGMLVVKEMGTSYFKDLKFSVKLDKTSETLTYQKINEVGKFIVGSYTIEIPVLPIIKLNGVKVRQSHTTTVEIPRPGIANLLTASPGYGSVYVRKGYDIEWVCNLNPDAKNESLVLLPGKYVVVYRPKNARNTLYSRSKKFEIKSGSVISINFN
jgi:Ca-activated chloride channel family protein